MKSRLGAGLGWAVVLFAIVAYGAALAGDYVFDDVHSVSANPAVHDLGNFGQFWTDPGAFSGAAGRMYRPALLTSFALNIALSPAAWSLKAGNVLLHAAVAGLLFWWLCRLSRKSRAAFVAAALFAVHPLCSESINLVSARSELLAMFGVLLAMLAHIGWQRRVAGLPALAAMLIGTVLAVGSKETGVVLPALLLVQTFCLRHRWPDRADWRRAAAAIVPVVGLVLLYLIARKLLLGEATVQLLGRSGEDPAAGYGRTLTMQLATMGTLLPRMLWQAVAPWQLSIDPVVVYRDSWLDPLVLLGWGSILGLTTAGLWPGPSSRLRRIGTCLAWAIALPWIVIPLNMPFAEHRFYGPMVGFAVLVAVAVARFRLQGRGVARGWRVALAGLLIAGAFTAGQRSLLYRDERELWLAELAHNPMSFRSHWGLGTARMRRGEFTAAIEPLQRAHCLYPEHHDSLRNLVEALISLPDAVAEPHRALGLAERLRDRTPDDPWVRTLMAQAHLQAGRAGIGDDHFATAERVALSCLEIAAPKGYVYQLAAAARSGVGDYEGALAHLDQSIARGLATTRVRLDRVHVLHELGQPAAARRALLELQRDCPTDPLVIGAMRQLATPPR